MIDISQINLNIYSKDELLNFSNSGVRNKFAVIQTPLGFKIKN